MTIAATSATKPATEALALLVLAALSTRTFTAAYRSRSPFAFYAGATILMWMCALGPHPTLFDKPALYRGPYALLMWLPGYDTGLRAPARFTMMTVLTLAVAAGLAVERIVRAASPATQRAFVVICTAGIVLDGLVWRVPVVNVPPRDTVPEPARRAAAVLELPADGAGRDIAAVMRTIGYHRPVVNGYSGYLPPHYRTFQTALDRHDVTVLGALARFGPIAIAVDRNGDHAAWKSFLDTVPTIAPAGNTPLHEWMLLPETTGPPEHDGGPLAIKHVSASGTARDVTALAYGGSRWTLARPQRGDELLEIELEDARDAATVLVGTGPEFECWPRALAISTSVDGRTWSDAWQGNAGGAAFLATLAAPRWPLLRFSFTPRRARFVRIHQTAHDNTYPWIVRSIAVLAP